MSCYIQGPFVSVKEYYHVLWHPLLTVAIERTACRRQGLADSLHAWCKHITTAYIARGKNSGEKKKFTWTGYVIDKSRIDPFGSKIIIPHHPYILLPSSRYLPNPTIHENRALLSYYAACSGQFPTDVSGQIIGPLVKGQDFMAEFLTLEYGSDRLSRNVGKELPILAG